MVEAQNNRSTLIDQALAGEKIIITRHGTPRRLDTSLRTGHALHIATFDHTLAEAARARGVAVLC
jgi:antitoxin (DNA-binding transcriptional repressor) of toxin-antitoxin stability system